MAELKTVATDASVHAFLETVSDVTRRQDCFELLALIQQTTGMPPKMWGESIVGFGEYHYKYASGRQGDWFLTGFAPRKQNLTLYIMSGFESYDLLLQKLGKHKLGKSCLYINKLDDLDKNVLCELVARSVEHMQKT